MVPGGDIRTPLRAATLGGQNLVLNAGTFFFGDAAKAAARAKQLGASDAQIAWGVNWGVRDGVKRAMKARGLALPLGLDPGPLPSERRRQLIASAMDKSPSQLNGLGDIFSDIGNALSQVGNAIVHLIEDIGKLISTAVNWVVNALNDAFTAIAKVLQDVANFIGFLGQVVWDLIKAIGALIVGDKNSAKAALSDLDPTKPGSTVNKLLLSPGFKDIVTFVFGFFLLPLILFEDVMNAWLKPNTGFSLPNLFDPGVWVEMFAELLTNINNPVQALSDFWQAYTQAAIGHSITPATGLQIAIYCLSSLPIPGPLAILNYIVSDPWVIKDLGRSGATVERTITAVTACLSATSAEGFITCANDILEDVAPGAFQALQDQGVQPGDLRALAVTVWKHGGRFDTMFDPNQNPGSSEAAVNVGVVGLTLLEGAIGGGNRKDEVDGPVLDANGKSRGSFSDLNYLLKTLQLTPESQERLTVGAETNTRIAAMTSSVHPGGTVLTAADHIVVVYHCSRNGWRIPNAILDMRTDPKFLAADALTGQPTLKDGRAVWQKLLRSSAGLALIKMWATQPIMGPRVQAILSTQELAAVNSGQPYTVPNVPLSTIPNAHLVSPAAPGPQTLLVLSKAPPFDFWPGIFGAAGAGAGFAIGGPIGASVGGLLAYAFSP